MLRVWQNRLLNNKLTAQYDFSIAGTHEIELQAGIYEVWLIGAGGGGAGTTGTAGGMAIVRGGVGGIIHAKINVPITTRINVNIGIGGGSIGGSGDHTGINGQNTSITGLTDVIIYAGGGTAGRVTHQGSIRIESVPGVQGTNSATGGNLLQIIENNLVSVISEIGVIGVQANTGWPENTNIGCGGGFSAKTTNFPSIKGGTGFVRIKASD